MKFKEEIWLGGYYDLPLNKHFSFIIEIKVWMKNGRP